MIRGIGLRGAIAVNVITMIGIGPLITIPLVLVQLHGSLALWAWVVGALIALCDGLVWAELGSLMPAAGGTYAYLRDAFGSERWGRLFAFLFAWQIIFAAPLLLASGYIGFAHYAAFLWPPLADWRLQGAVGAAVGLVTLALLYRRINRVAATGLGLAAVAVLTLVAVIAAALPRFSVAQAFSTDPHVGAGAMLAAGLGPALVITLYDYYGYGQACTIGEEVHTPAQVLPRSTVASIFIVGGLYVVLQIAVLGAIPWTTLIPSVPGGSAPATADYVASTVVAQGWGVWAARVATLAILVTAFASTFGNLLGYARIPYAAARDGVFLRWFAALHPSGRFPHVALLTIGLLALPACFMPLGEVISWMTTSLVIVQSLAQIAALFVLRYRGVRSPYRMWLFPVPAILAAAAWVYVFFSTDAKAIAFGLLTVGAGVVVYMGSAKLAARWPFATKAAVFVLALGAAIAFGRAPALAQPSVTAPPAGPPSFTHSAIVERDGFPIFEVNHKPFFVYGAAFFYERLPRSEWETSLRELRAMGFNTLDLYVMWNWHELADGDFDFTGRASPRRDLHSLLRLARQYGFKLIVRPGPVIRNEWRNGGYPAWLLKRPEYGMPLHDLLEGRYPPTATLQNARSDDAAAEWLGNATHLRYSKRWLQRVMREFRPYADLVLAVALDDDQGAYLDNQTWPAPHLTAYLDWLAATIHGVTGPSMPVFINTYQMKVTASSPVWAMGNWYQSDAYSIGEHDRAQLELTLGMLQTRPHQPLMLSEFQAGWLLGPDDIRPRPADPSNTLLAMTTAIGMGARGIVDFPPQDTLYPTGWEAPFANFFYAWDAALGLGGPQSPRMDTSNDFGRFESFERSPRYEPTARVGEFVSSFGPLLARAKPHWDAGILYTPSGMKAQDLLDYDVVARGVQNVLDTQQDCRAASLACRLVDPRYGFDAATRRLPIIFVPAVPRVLVHGTYETLDRYAAAGGIVVPLRSRLTKAVADHALAQAQRSRTVDFAPGATFATLAGGGGFLTLPNYGDRPLTLMHVVVHIDAKTKIDLPQLVVPPRGVLLTPLEFDLRTVAPALKAPVTLVASDCPLVLEDATHHELGLAFDGLALAFEANGAACTFHLRSARGAQSVAGSRGLGLQRDGTVVPVHYRPIPHGDPYTIAGLPAQIFLRDDVKLPGNGVLGEAIPERQSVVRRADVFEDGSSAVVLQNARVRVIFSPDAGARGFVFEDVRNMANVFTSVGALRDDVTVEPPPSKTDKIAAYTHQFPAGMFNRPYSVAVLESGTRAVVRLWYDAPDVVPSGARFERIVTLEPDQRTFSVDEQVDFHGIGAFDIARGQRAVSVTSLAVGDTVQMKTQETLTPDVAPFIPDKTLAVSGDGLAFFDSVSHELATIAWRHGDVERADLLERRYSAVARLTAALGKTTHVEYGLFKAASTAAARAQLDRAIRAAQGPPVVPSNNTE